EENDVTRLRRTVAELRQPGLVDGEDRERDGSEADQHGLSPPPPDLFGREVRRGESPFWEPFKHGYGRGILGAEPSPSKAAHHAAFRRSRPVRIGTARCSHGTCGRNPPPPRGDTPRDYVDAVTRPPTPHRA